MNNFKELIEEDIRSKLSSKGVMLAKYAKDVLRAKIGDQRAAGRLDLRYLVVELQSSLDRFLGQQGKEPSISSISEYIKYVLGANIPDDALEAMLPNRADIDIQSPNDEEIYELVKDLVNNYKSMSPDDLKALVAEITSYVNDTADEDLVVEFMKHLRINHPEILQLPEMEKLAPLGERISDDRVEQLLITIARNMLKNDALAAHGKDGEKGADEDKQDKKDDEEKKNDPSGRQPLSYSYTEGTLTRIAFFDNLSEMGIKRVRIDKWADTNEDGRMVFLADSENIRRGFNFYTVEEMNQISALCITLIAQRFSQPKFRQLVVEPFENQPEFNLSHFDVLASQGYKMGNRKEPVSGIVDLINQRFKVKDDSSFLVMCCFAAVLEIIDLL